MISDLDESIKKLFDNYVPEEWVLASANLSFDRPDHDWLATNSGPTINMYLYDIRENLKTQTSQPKKLPAKNGSNNIETWPPPKRIDCMYCITAWVSADSDATQMEHRLLSQVLRFLLNHKTLPEDVLVGELINEYVKYPTSISIPEELKNQTEFWNTLNQVFKPSINYTVTLSMFPYDNDIDISEPVTDVKINPRHMEEYHA